MASVPGERRAWLGRRGACVGFAVAILAVGGLGDGPTGRIPSGGVMTGCFTQSCDPSAVNRTREQGRLIDADTWESTPFEAPWLEYTGNRTINFNTELLGNRLPSEVIVYISAEEQPLSSGSFTIAGGNVADIFGVRPGGLSVRNNTCAAYFMRVVVRAPRVP